MRSFAAAALLLGAAVANPVPQDFDWDAIDAMDPLPDVDIPVVNAADQAFTSTYNTAAAATSAYAAVTADGEDSSLKVRDTADTAANWRANSQWGNDATAATTPSGYSLIFQNAGGSSQEVFGYMGFSVLSSYNVAKCASNCKGIKGCSSFNIYYERDPSTDPTSSNPDPASVTVIKCVYYGGPLDAAKATNSGQMRMNFEVAVAGSNGYQSTAIAVPAGYSLVSPLGTAAINAPLDCNNKDTYITVKTFDSGIFDVGRCAAACSAESDWLRRSTPAGQPLKQCQFFNTYVLYNNSIAQGQICSLYTESWPKTFATNKGQYRGKDFWNIAYSFTYANTTAGMDKPVGCTNPTKPS